MKPRVFIGSSVEAVSLAYAIQENLYHDATVTVWDQGVFELSSNTLDDLLKALNNFDFGVFLFQPDDITHLRRQKLDTVRDNVVFELGLFIGKLGKDKVFFVVPDSASNLHLPTDLLGIMPGKYQSNREDGNLKAALAPFCNQVRNRLKAFAYENLIDFANENKECRRLAVEKPPYWEFMLTSELLKARLEEVNRSYLELEKGLVFQRSKRIDLDTFRNWLDEALTDFTRMIGIFKQVFEVEMYKSWGEPGVAGNTFEIKAVVDKIISLCKEFLAWEYELQGLILPDEVTEIKGLMMGWSRVYLDTVNQVQAKLERSFSPESLAEGGHINIKVTVPSPPNIEAIVGIMHRAILSLKDNYHSTYIY